MKFKKEIILFAILLGLIFCIGVITSNHTTRDDRNNTTRDDQNRNHVNLIMSDWTGPIKYDFESDTISQDPTGEDLTIYEPSGCGYVEVNNVASRKCTVINKTGGNDRVYLRDDIGDTNYTAGEIHFWAYHDSSGFAVVLESAKNENLIDMAWWNGDIRRNGPSGPILTSYTYDTWIEVVIYFDLGQGWMFDLDNTRYGNGYAYPFTGAFTTNTSHILWASFWSGNSGDFCVDDIGYDNLVEENRFYNLTGTPIFIDDADPNYNWSKTAIENPWCSGSGTWNDPYVIERVLMDGNNIGTCITIQNSNVPFMIRNCTLYNAEKGIKILNASNFNITDNTIYNIHGKDGINGDTGAQGGDGTGAKGIIIDNCTNINISLNKISNILGGNGGHGGNGATGSPGGNGGNGNYSYGLFFNNSRNIIMANNNISTIRGGNGGNGGMGGDNNIGAHYYTDGGTGGKGDSGIAIYFIDCVNIKIECNNISNIIGGCGSVGGKGGSGVYAFMSNPKDGGFGGNGGRGGVSIGIYFQDCINTTNYMIDIRDIISGTGGNGGNGGNGGKGYAPASGWDQAGYGGEGGKGNNGGLSSGVYSANSINVKNNLNEIYNIKSGSGGNGGIGGIGGEGMFAAPYELQPGDGGKGGDGGNGSSNSGIYLINCTEVNNEWNDISVLISGSGGKGGNGGNGGFAQIVFLQGVNGGNGGDGGDGSSSSGIYIINCTKIKNEWNNISNNIAGNGGNGGNGGSIVQSGSSIDAGKGGEGGDGSSYIGICLINSTEIKNVWNIISDIISGNGGNGGNGGNIVSIVDHGGDGGDGGDGNSNSGIYLINCREIKNEWNNISNIISGSGGSGGDGGIGEIDEWGTYNGGNGGNGGDGNSSSGIYLINCREIKNNWIIIDNIIYGSGGNGGKTSDINALEDGFTGDNGIANGLTLVKSNEILNSMNSIYHCNTNAVSLLSSHNNTFLGNDVFNNMNGIFLASQCSNNIITENNVFNNTNGIYLASQCSNNTISGNDVFNNTNGIYLASQCSNNTILGNLIKNNHYGINIDDINCQNNLIYLNSLIKNLISHVRDSSITTHYDNGSIGNYWDDYTGFDINGDGIGESPYYISYSFFGWIVDHYPICVIPPPFLDMNIIEQSFSIQVFNLTFFIHNCRDEGIPFAKIQMWWNGENVSDDIISLPGGLYFVSLTAIPVAPGENGILLNMTILATGYNDKYFEIYLAVDPELIDKTPETGPSPPSEGGGGGKAKKAERPAIPLITLVAVGVGSAIGAGAITIFILRKRILPKREIQKNQI
jgi:parallel beta-helix repeat protein